MKVLTYLINLDGSDARLAQASKQLNALGYDFERFSAYDGRGKSLADFEEYDDSLAKTKLGRSLLSSELGCYLSHYGCAQRFLQTEADYLVVLEDDMRIDDDFKRHVDGILSYLHARPELDWYLINIAAKKKKLAKDIATIDEISLWHAYYFPIRGLGLIWSRQGAQAFVNAGMPMHLPVDIFFQSWLSQNGKGLGVWPALVRPAGLDSDILGTVASQKIARKQKENRQRTYTLKRQQRMMRDKLQALKHQLLDK